MSPTAHELVSRGAALLDEKLPGWADQIDLDTLAMEDACRCVLGQLGSDRVNLDRLSWEPRPLDPYDDGFNLFIEAARMSEQARVALGFDRWDRAHPTYASLQDAWKGEIVARRTLDAL